MSAFSLRLPDKIHMAVQKLRDAGYEAYVVGGCVRDTLLGKEPHDWDIATSAVPQRIKEIFGGYPQIDAGLKHGTVMVVVRGETIEITTYRIDGEYSDNRRPDSVSFTADIAEDLSRRDFTINACAAAESELIDPFGGQKDAEDRLLRCVGDPRKRFTEDALRILRGIRFASVLDFRIEKKTKEAMFLCRDLLKNVSQERITEEFCKTLLGVNVKDTLDEFKDILVLILPEMADTIGFEQHNSYHIYDVFEHTLHAVEAVESDRILRAAMLFHDIAKPQCFTLDQNGVGHFYGHPKISAEMTKGILQRMRFSTADIEAITALILHHDMKIEATPKGVKRALSRLGELLFGRLLKVKRADIMAQNPIYKKENLEYVETVEKIGADILAQNACVSLKDLAVHGGDLMELGIPEGKRVGDVLNHLLELVLDEKIENSKEALLKEAMKSQRFS